MADVRVEEDAHMIALRRVLPLRWQGVASLPDTAIILVISSLMMGDSFLQSHMYM